MLKQTRLQGFGALSDDDVFSGFAVNHPNLKALKVMLKAQHIKSAFGLKTRFQSLRYKQHLTITALPK